MLRQCPPFQGRKQDAAWRGSVGCDHSSWCIVGVGEADVHKKWILRAVVPRSHRWPLSVRLLPSASGGGVGSDAQNIRLHAAHCCRWPCPSAGLQLTGDTVDDADIGCLTQAQIPPSSLFPHRYHRFVKPRRYFASR